MSVVMPLHIILPGASEFASKPRTKNRFLVFSNVFAPLGIPVKLLATVFPAAKKFSISHKLAVFQTNRSFFFEFLLLSGLGTGAWTAIPRRVGRGRVDVMGNKGV